MTDPLLLTKLCMPILRSGLVSRPRLSERLIGGLWQEDGFNRSLTLVSAPAGYGKTTLLVDWLRSAGWSAAWLSLDEADNDPVRFLGYLVAAIRQARPGFGDVLQGMLQAPQPPPAPVILTTLLNELSALSSPLLLVLDDYHLIHNPAIHQHVAFLLDHQPARFHLAVLTREDPLLPVARLRARGRLLEMRQEELQFTPQETGEFLNRAMGLALSGKDILALEQRTEGWIAGLQLAALSLRGRSDPHNFIQDFTGSSRYILDYLVEEVFERQPPEVQDFLLKTSILDRLCGPLCAAVAGRPGSQEQLRHMEQANLFLVPLDASGAWFRYHHLFSELLRHRLRSTHPDLEPALHRQASRWFEAAGYFSEAVEHNLAACDWGEAARLIDLASESMLKRGELVTLIAWYHKFPADLSCRNPDLCLAFGWALLLAGYYDEAGSLLAKAEQLWQDNPALLGHVYAAQAYWARARGDDDLVVAKSNLALAQLPESETTSRTTLLLNLGLVHWHAGRMAEAGRALAEARELAQRSNNMYVLLTAQVFLVRIAAVRGELRQAMEMYQPLIQIKGDVPILALVHFDLATIYCEWNELEKAAEHLQRGLEISRKTANHEFEFSGLTFWAVLQQARGETGAALAALEQAHAMEGEFSPASRARVYAGHALTALACGNLPLAEQQAARMEAAVDCHPFYRFLELTQARLLLAKGDKAAAAARLAVAVLSARQAGWGYGLAAALALQALTAPTRPAALESLKEALEIAQKAGLIRTFVDIRPSLVPLLQEAVARGIYPEAAGRILAVLGTRYKPALPPQPLAEPLSERELAVLRLVAAGLSNREIARQLVISTGTAKTHIHNICGKLGAANRTAAVQRARELALI